MIFHTPMGGKLKLVRAGSQPGPGFRWPAHPGAPARGGVQWGAYARQQGAWISRPTVGRGGRGGGAGQQPVLGLRDGSKGHTRRHTGLLSPRLDPLRPPGPDGVRSLSRSGAQTALGAARTAWSTWESPGGPGRRASQRGPPRVPGWGQGRSQEQRRAGPGQGWLREARVWR